LDRGDIFLNTANVDNAPVVLLEAMACGLCVVSTNVGGIPRLVSDGREGLLVPPRDPEAMAAAVRRVLDEPGLGGGLSRAGGRHGGAFGGAATLPRWRRVPGGAADGARR